MFTTVYDDESFIPVARVVQSRQAQGKTQGNTQGNDNDKVELFKIYHYHNNHLGTPQELTNEQGEVVWCNYEWAWGGKYTHFYKEQSLNGCAILEHELQPIRFQGQSFDVETSLHYNRFRYYDTDVGMFIQRDPIGLLGGVNVFAYAPNPIHWVDPFGLSPCNGTKINNRAIINSNLAGKTVNTAGGPVTFDKDGFPDFTPYSIRTVRVNGLTGDMSKDVPKALEAAGLKATDVSSSYVWHHHQDGKSMMLVPHNVHTIRFGGIGHTGGRAVIKHNLNHPNNQLNYPSPPLK